MSEEQAITLREAALSLVRVAQRNTDDENEWNDAIAAVESAAKEPSQEELLWRALTAACQEILRQDKILSLASPLSWRSRPLKERRHIDFRFRLAVARIADHRSVDGDLELVAKAAEQTAPDEINQGGPTL